MRDSPLVVITLLWVGAVILLIARFDGETPADPMATPPPGPVSLPAELTFGLAVDDAGVVHQPQERFSEGSELAYVGWLGAPVGLDEVQIELIRLRNDATSVTLWQGEAHAVDPQETFVRGVIAAPQLAELDPGSYRLRLVSDGEVLAAGAFQYETGVPESITAFADRVDALLQPGEHTGYRFDEDGEVTETHVVARAEEEPVRAARRATFNGTQYLLIVEGIEGPYWFREPEAVVLADSP